MRTLELVITAWKEPKTTAGIIKSVIQAIPALKALGFDLKKITVVAPDRETHDAADKIVKQFNIKILTHIQDPQKGKPYALNLVLPKLKQDITIFTDGDVIIKPQSFVKLVKPFKKYKKVGATTGRPVPLNDRNTMLGFWAWLTTQAGAHQHRLIAQKTGKPMNVSGYFFAVLTKLMPKKIPANLKAEDAYFSYLFRKTGYKIWYTPRARVYVMFPKTFKDWLKQKVRAVGGDHQLNMMFSKQKEFKNMRSFFKEIAGIRTAIVYPRNIKEYLYLIPLLFARLYLWLLIFWKYSIKKEMLDTVGWERVESTKLG